MGCAKLRARLTREDVRMKTDNLTIFDLFRVLKKAIEFHQPGRGYMALAAALLILSVLGSLQPRSERRVYIAGEVADTDIMAHRDLTVEDSKATRLQREKVADMQPTVFDLRPANAKELRDSLLAILKLVNTERASNEPGTAAGKAGAHGADEKAAHAKTELTQKLSAKLGTPITQETLGRWADPIVQKFMLDTGLPWFERMLVSGAVADSRQLITSKGGILVRNQETQQETLRHDTTDIPDLSLLLVQFSQLMRDNPHLDTQSRRAIDRLFSSLVKPTLIMNREATLELGAHVAKTVKPVFYTIRKGEIVVSKGESITPETQLKLQSLLGGTEQPINFTAAGGLFLISLFITLGLFIAPSGRFGTKLKQKDFWLITVLVLFTGLLALAANMLFARVMTPAFFAQSIYAFPAAGTAGLAALMFAARRYSVVCLLTALFSAAMFKAGLSAFLFFFLLSMLNTWLILRAQTRQDVVLSLIPLCFSTAVLAIGAGLLEGYSSGQALITILVFSLFNGLLSVFMLFAVSPILEMIFQYTTRFRLMELMNMEQPLLRELMVTIPGTYHHSLIVSNMVESGAKAIGANSLLCKVAALYHDVGKLARPEYFIENQYGGPNRHDKLAPAMSALILCSHVKRGTEMAQKYHLGEEIEDIIRQHHGTSVMRFFYRKAQEQGENPKAEDFSYPGPRPRTREAAIVMLADVVEASSRTLTDPTPARITTHIDSIVKNIFADGQLDESDLTFKDLHILSESFARILTGLFHQRIAYPEEKKNADGEQKAEAKQNGTPADAPAKTPVQSMEPGSKNAKGTPNAAASMP